MINPRWPDEKRARLLEMIASGMNAVDIGQELGHSHFSILSYCGINGIKVIKYPPEMQATFDDRANARREKQNERKKQRDQQARLAIRQVRLGVTKTVVARPEPRKPDKAVAPRTAVVKAAKASVTKLTTPELRARYPMPLNPTKSELQSVLRQAVLNTAAMQSAEAAV